MMPHVRPALLVPLVAMVALSGCLDDGQDATGDPTPTAAPEDDGPPLDLPADVVDEAGLPVPVQLSPPDWTTGTAWRYAVDGAWVARPYMVTLGVVAVEPDRYVVGADAVEEVTLDVLHGVPFTGGIARDDLAVRQHGAWQPLVRFGDASGASWTITFYGQPLTLRSFPMADLPGPNGASPGIRAIGTSPDGHRLVVDYHAEEGAYTRIDWRHGDQVLLRYLLDGAARVPPDRLTTWRIVQEVHVETSSILPVESRAWESDGRGDLLVVALGAEAARVGRGTVWDPQVRPAVAVVAVPDAAVEAVVALPDRVGTWRLAATSLGTQVSASIYQIDTSGPLRMQAAAQDAADDGLLPIDLPLPRLTSLDPVLG